MPNKAALALALDRVWCYHLPLATPMLAALSQVPADAMLRVPGLETYAAEKAETPLAFAVGTPVVRAEDRKPYAVIEGVAFIELSGPLLQRVSSFDDGTSTIYARRQARVAAADPDVKEIVFLIDSPGGQSSGLGCLADDIRAIGEKKNTVAYLSSICASAAYWIASACRSVVASPYCEIGSIGCYTVIPDDVEFWAQKGVKFHLVSSGGIKGQWAVGQEVGEDLIAMVQREVDAVMDDFVDAVARGRNMTSAQVREVGTGECWRAKDALSLGLIDAIGTEDDVLSGLIGARAPGS